MLCVASAMADTKGLLRSAAHSLSTLSARLRAACDSLASVWWRCQRSCSCWRRSQVARQPCHRPEQQRDAWQINHRRHKELVALCSSFALSSVCTLESGTRRLDNGSDGAAIALAAVGDVLELPGSHVVVLRNSACMSPQRRPLQEACCILRLKGSFALSILSA